ncbi:hypothetical protein ORIO_18575 [Cereibacter azotoformans]|uniref:CRISPR system precrRNA processing endoribonuclease RAMP protein Cas6 n=1 Tax=Cereibacter azotoformans TaxID=43057 RepID=UPI001EEA1574|nr:CRISPR system precrRNA processing endoribonuclease RAMP protein Cas6 [Cereibacter azotoformans]ULB11841.1 hypothetical protein ORIO_18575 [Cereibacter azotoformans]
MLDIEALSPGSAPLLQRPELLHRLRGAVGNVLAQWASAEALRGQSCPFDPPCAFDLFHNAQGFLARGREIPKPFVLRADVRGKDLVLTLRLFGRAVAWASEFQAGLVGGMRRGLEWPDTGPLALPVRMVLRHEVAPARPSRVGALRVATITPLIQRGDDASEDMIDPTSFVTGLANRLSGMAQWHGHTLVLDGAALRDRIRASQPEARGRTVPLARGRKTRRGFAGTLSFPDCDAAACLVLALGAECHAGADTSTGAGRYRIET